MNTTTTPQLLPLHIEYDGPAPVDTYFHVGQDEEGNNVAAFRGRVMYGVDLALPDGYAGVVLRTGEENQVEPPKKKRDVIDVDASGTRLDPGQTFDKIGLWRADVPVDLKSDEYVRALDEWTRMATLVHAPEEDEIQPNQK
ncbi:hypothetical protein FS749_006044 [Ceratobasidium sp. UAMH 11750]|nr:hypothetical protein FS749_006044 [Ceratobasidium sp. UAMH 11750]